MPELLLELLSEEIPARMQARAAEDLSRLLSARIAPLLEGEPRAFHGPRRLTLTATLRAAVVTEGREERGPRVGAPEQALQGFLRKHGAAREALSEQNGFWVLNKPGERVESAAMLARELPPLLRGFPWPKSMRWGASGFAWVRPLRRVLCLLDGEPVRFALAEGADEAHGLVSGDTTEGHRVMAPGAFAVRGFADYEAGLRQRRVVLDAAERADLIRKGVASLAAGEALEVVPDEALVAEVAGLVEWPVPLLGRIDDAFMDLPPEVMRSTMRANQKYFSLRRPGGGAAPRFAVVANIEATDGGAAVAAGNERVLRARLSDARFFWDLDRKQKLEDFLPKLDSVVFHAKLGTQGERVRRLEALAALIAPMVGANMALAARAARLAKADLASGMVGEFPELQGVMGRYYALNGGEDARIADAVGTHYQPLGPNDGVPREPTAVAVALADKLDQLAGFFVVGERPTGSGDPFALRRSALGVIRIVRENGLRLALLHVLEHAVKEAEASALWAQGEPLRRAAEEFERHGGTDLASMPGRHSQEVQVPGSDRWVNQACLDLLHFLAERLRVQLRAEGARHDLVAAVFGAAPDDDLVRLLARADALKALVEGPDGPNLLTAYRRAANILRIEDKKDGPHTGAPDPALLRAPEEAALAEALDRAAPAARERLAAEDFAGAMAELAALRPPLDAFFDRVTVNDADPELRRNRLRLLASLRDAMDAVADLSKIEG
ncbi:glycine--tRNA ligase subunit beta [Craurococcus roseus]|uniref:Glycine--tRNA ligase beta subunit n=1 Tax=Craurococcus roseus TaxID=77585 RepID=A0ABN1F3Z6_9PROT